MNNLVIVESPTKARTLQKFLGSDYQIEASMGHIRDLPKAELGVDVENDFEPGYIIPSDKRKKVNELKQMAQGAEFLYLATDPDREGEAIAWHLSQLLVDSSKLVDKNKKKKNYELRTTNSPLIQRVVFHEITKEAITQAFEQPRGIDLKLVDAQQARRILDRLVGYKLSPLLWAKIKKGLSAGRVQSVALRLIVEREREVLAFKALEYWIIEAELQGGSVKGKGESFVVTLIEQNGKKLEIKNEKEANKHKSNLEKAEYIISKVTQKEVRRYPHPPFITSTLQQTAANRLGMSAKKTMMIAQALYEHGFITYMRTDSVNLSTQAVESVRSYIGDFFGKSYLPKVPRIFKSKSRNAQEAHEAIRPSNVALKSEGIKPTEGFNRDHIKLYELIRNRFVACQMSEAIMDQTIVDVTAGDYLLRASGSVIKFDGWLKLYGKDIEEEDNEGKKDRLLPQLSEKQILNLMQLLPTQHFTEAPPRFNEASLIKKLEELGIGRPSTYAPTLSTIQDRFYVEKVERKFMPTKLGFIVCDFLIEYFPDIFDYSFTAKMEDALDEIARGEREWRPTIKEFYQPFSKKLDETEKVAKKVKMELEFVDKKCPDCNKELVIRIGKFGKFLACSGFPDCKHTQALEEIVDAKCPQDGGDMVIRRTRHGKTFYGCKNWPDCKFASWTKPKSADKSQTTSETK